MVVAIEGLNVSRSSAMVPIEVETASLASGHGGKRDGLEHGAQGEPATVLILPKGRITAKHPNPSPPVRLPRSISQAQNSLMVSAWKCDFSVSWAYDPTGELGEEYGAASLPCSDCGGPAGCHAHAFICPGCLKAVCDGCVEEHACAMIYGGKAA